MESYTTTLLQSLLAKAEGVSRTTRHHLQGAQLALLILRLVGYPIGWGVVLAPLWAGPVLLLALAVIDTHRTRKARR